VHQVGFVVGEHGCVRGAQKSARGTLLTRKLFVANGRNRPRAAGIEELNVLSGISANAKKSEYADGENAAFHPSDVSLVSGNPEDDAAEADHGSEPSTDAMPRGASAAASDSVPLGELSDQELLDGIRLQSEIHFAELYNRYFQRIYNFVYARMRNHAETEEVVQETFLAVFRSFGNYRGQSSLLSWIYGIAKNTTNNSIRRAKSQTERIDLADDEDVIPRPSIGVGTPEEQLDLNRFRDTLSTRLDGLADWQVEIFHMRHFENLSIPEISQRTSRSSDAVRSSLYRVKRIFFDAAMNPASTSTGIRGARR
jgi:RNA polymerase sigma-70 factor (ECF subfamily)